ncbi:MAG: tetratricopeptide repeat protein [Vicinamibacterales bacterium]
MLRLHGAIRHISSSRVVVAALYGSLVLCVASLLLAQGDPKTATLEQAGWDAIRAGQPEAAAQAFSEAVSREPRNPRLHLGAGTAAFLQRRDADAQQSLERALQLDAKLVSARSLLGLVVYRRGDVAMAIRVYEQLVIETPDDEQARTTLDRWRREWDLHASMRQTVDTHFTVSVEGPDEADLAAKAVELLERAYWRIGDILAAYPPTWIPVVLYTEQQFRDITRSPSWAAGAYDGTIRIPVRGALENPKELERILTHEFAHALVHSLGPRGVPTWLHEGVAAALESEDLSWANDRVRTAGAIISLDSLQTSFARLSGDDARLAYATSAIIVHRLIGDVGGPAVASLLRDLGKGTEFDIAFERHTHRSWRDLQSGLAVP